MTTRFPSRLPREGDALGNRAADASDDAIRRIATQAILKSNTVEGLVFTGSMRYAVAHSDTTGASAFDTALTVTSEDGVLFPNIAAPSPSVLTVIKRIQLPRPRGRTDRLTVMVTPTISLPENWVDSSTQFPFMALEEMAPPEDISWGIQIALGSPDIVDIRFGNMGGTPQATRSWAALRATGFRWKLVHERGVGGALAESTADDLIVEHGLARLPIGFLVVSRIGPATVFVSPTENPAPERLIFLRSTAPCTATILFY